MDSANIAHPQFEIPCNVRSEQVVLGCLIEDGSLLPCILDSGLNVNSFMLSDHRRIFQAILDLHQQSAPIDCVTVAERLGNKASDFALLADLICGVVVDASHALYHAKIVRKKAALRKVMKIGEWLQTTAADASANPEQLTNAAIEKLQGVRL